ncbi:hypothetical protein ASG49_15585 [Marmoricola sp. Leaf446]|uniref:hypothetical protein n=1 Tax=Marmoricola sp. Leaf446 TaxID=1736379 RepID=UPI0006F7D1C6|nr:hypothetical protein [Marmoricola sp. Leaf446]KQT89219.1 hypothetical protein ASG49_15585 [Marmoricola sp. Leaf446]
METISARIRRTTAALAAATMIGVVGVGALAPETASAAGVRSVPAYATTVATGTSLLPGRED